MAKARKGKGRGSPTEDPGLPRPWSEFLGVALLAVGGLMLGGLLSYQLGAGNLMGPVGRLVAGALYASFGMAAYLVTLGVVGMGVKALLGQRMELRLGEGIGFAVATLAGCVLLHVVFPRYRVHGYTAGGLTGELVGEVSLGLFHYAGTYLVAVTVMCVGLLASTPLRARHLVALGRLGVHGARTVASYLWGGAVGIARAQRDAVMAAANEPSLDDASAEYDEDADEYEEYEEYEDEDEDAGAGEEYEDEDEELESDEVDDHDDEADEQADDSEEPAPSAPAKAEGTSKSNRKRSRKPSEVPEIVVQKDDGRERRRAMADGPGKKAPPRPESLAKAPVAANESAERPKQPHMPGVIRLTNTEYELPPLKLFEAADLIDTEFDRGFVLEQAERLVAVLKEFRIQGKVTKIHPGPVITRYEFKPEAGVKLSKIENLENDVAMALEAIRIRILAPIPGKASVGFEVPNRIRETVYLKEILADEHFGAGKAKLPLALGKDITGRPNSVDLDRAPHLLVAGATGSGKSVGINSMICSLLYTCSPDDVRLIMIDPKMLELSIYEGIPHLLLPVVTDAEKANLALRWAVDEMERRYAMLSKAQVRNIEGFNKKLPELAKQWEVEKKEIELEAARARAAAATEGEEAVPGSMLPGISTRADGEPVPSVGDVEMPPKPDRLPYIVIIIDEFADLMMVASKEVEQNVSRIAAKARAAGIHLIVATQRPSVDVITGTIKNNFPSRIAFQVTADADSRTILDAKGAKQLLGMGDMLHMDRGGEPQRVHGCFVSEEEILKVVKFIKKQAKPVYNLDIVRKRDDDPGDERDDSFDPLYDRAVSIVAEAQKVSTSMLQRKLGVGYNRAAKIVEKMEEQGAIGPSRGTTPREVYVTAA